MISMFKEKKLIEFPINSLPSDLNFSEGKYVISPKISLGGSVISASSDQFSRWSDMSIESYTCGAKVHSVGINIFENSFVDENFLNLDSDKNVISNSDVLHSFYRSKKYKKCSEFSSFNLETAINFLTPNFAEFGHFLIEILPRLLLLKKIYGARLSHPLLVPSVTPKYIVETLDLLFSEYSLIEVQESSIVNVSRLLVPSLLSIDHIFHPFADYLFSDFVHDISSKSGSCDFGKKIFISRENFKRDRDFRILKNENEIIEYLMNDGFLIIRPEVMSVREQVEIFSTASVIVGEAGSGLHNSIFSPCCARVVSLNYINGVQNFIARLRGHVMDYINPSDGVLRTPENTAVKRIIPREFKIDLFELGRCI